MKRLSPKQQREQDRHDVRTVLDTPMGRRLAWRFLCGGGIFNTTAVFGAADQTYFNEGRRSLALEMLTHFETHAPGSMDLMRKENTDAQPAEVAAADDDEPAEDA